MCGIVGYLGPQDAARVILDGLRRLEYRGYDSAGLAVVHNGRLEIRRRAGKLANLAEALREAPVTGRLGIGHTRWATHGRPTEENAHPHRDCTGQLVVIHNGIIENYLSLKRRLQGEGHTFVTETDTEVISHLVESHYRGSLEAAVRAALAEVQGAYALVLLHAREPETIIAARYGPPLVVGHGDGEYFVASDIPALLPHTRRMYFLDDGELAVLTPAGVRVSTLAGEPRQKVLQTITWDPIQAEKGGYRHFMLKEIYEQPRALEDTVRGRVDRDRGVVVLEELGVPPERLARVERAILVACGTSWHAALVGKFMLERLARIPCEVDIGSEFRYRDPIVNDRVLTVAISQSGETADTIAAEREAKAKGACVLAICNVVGSMITRLADGVLYTRAGPEIGVASTKAFTTQLVALYLLALHLGRLRGVLGSGEVRQRIENLVRLPALVERALEAAPQLEALAKELATARNCLYLGRGIAYPIALEGALKLKEISYIHAEGYPAGEMKHGPIALIDETMPVVVLAPQGPTYEKVLSNLQEAKARGGRILAVATEGDEEVARFADAVVPVPAACDLLTPVVLTIPLQLLAYQVAVARGTDVDQPRNLAKSVTVE
ncbi:MAG TPA: glutamine--fructose-6-phosphate transaminase (isomerizing) [Thermodesulfobacteriota bacterium]|nr:glutamine--fructose-6-phosphate transaminase (isomerizing) [Thermodesulfobacteriota bacterium]